MVSKEQFRDAVVIPQHIKLFIHNKTSEQDVNDIGLQLLTRGLGGKPNDDDAHILAKTETAVAYRVRDEIYIIPARVKEVPMAVTIDKNKPCVHLVFEYPCEMKVEDLVKY